MLNLDLDIIRALYSKFSENSIEQIKMKLIHCFLKWIVFMDSTTHLQYYLHGNNFSFMWGGVRWGYISCLLLKYLRSLALIILERIGWGVTLNNSWTEIEILEIPPGLYSL